MKVKEILNILSKPWVSTQDIMLIVNLTTSTAGGIKRTIEADFRKKYPNKYLPSHCVPTKGVIQYFDIDIEFLKSLININDDNLNNTFNNHN